MQTLKNYIFESSQQGGFDTSWFLSDECCDLYNKTKETAPDTAYKLYLIIDNTTTLWSRINALMKSAVRHSDFDPEYCATCSTMNKIIRDGIKEYNKYEDKESKITHTDADFRKAVGMLLVTGWEE